MADALGEIVDVSISLETAVAMAAGFGEPLVLTAAAHFPDRVTRISKASELTDAGYVQTDPEYLLVSRLLTQQPRRVRTVAMGRRLSVPTQRFSVTPVVANTARYEIEVSMGATTQTVGFTSDADATVGEIIAGLKAAIDALGVAVTTSDQTTFLRIAANVPGAFFSLRASNVERLRVIQDQDDPGLGAELDGIVQGGDSRWYAILNPFNSDAAIAGISAWAELNGKLFLAQTQNGLVPSGSTTDIASTLGDPDRTALFYSPATKDFLDAAAAGKQLPKEPGTSTWARKAFVGVTAPTLTTAQRGHLKAKRVSFYQSVAGLGDLDGGRTASGQWIDVIRDRDWLISTMGSRVYTVMHNAEKVALDDGGIESIVNAVRSALNDAEEAGFIRADPKYTVSAPLAEEISAEDKGARNIPGIEWTAEIAGAAHSATIHGVLTL